MLLKACVILVAIAVSARADECPDLAQDECIPSENFPLDYPETAEELLRDCDIMKKVARCYIEIYEKNCPEQEDEIGGFEKYLNYVEAECQKDSHIFQALSRNIACATPVARSLNEVCSWDNFSEEEKDNLIALVQPLWDRLIYHCPHAVHKITCYSHVISERCGSELKDVVTDILENTDFSYGECNEEYLKELLPFKEYYETLLIKQEMFEDTSKDEE